MIRELATRGGVDDSVLLRVAGRELVLTESYEVHCSLFEQPAAFSVRLGHAGTSAELISLLKPGSKFELLIGGLLQYSGLLGGHRVSSGETSSVDFSGRDYLRRLHDTMLDGERRYSHQTYRELVETQLKEAGVANPTVLLSNVAERSKRAGVTIKTTNEPRNVSELVVEKGKGNKVYSTVTSELGETRLNFVKRHFERAGLFLWAGRGENVFVIGSPNADQDTLFRLERHADYATAKLVTYVNETDPPRYGRYVVYGRSGGKKFGFARVRGEYVDPEMQAFGIDTLEVQRDADVADEAQAIYHAKWRCAMARRQQWALAYEVPGHTWPVVYGGGRAVWTFDIMVHVNDSLVGIDRPLWVSDVTFRRDESGTKTTVHLMRPEDLIFSQEPA